MKSPHRENDPENRIALVFRRQSVLENLEIYRDF